MPHLEITEVVLVHCFIVSDDYQHDSRVLSIFTPNKSFALLNKSYFTQKAHTLKIL